MGAFCRMPSTVPSIARDFRTSSQPQGACSAAGKGQVRNMLPKPLRLNTLRAPGSVGSKGSRSLEVQLESAPPQSLCVPWAAAGSPWGSGALWLALAGGTSGQGELGRHLDARTHLSVWQLLSVCSLASPLYSALLSGQREY